jgi:hypothetical protein
VAKGRRLGKLYGALTARERAALVLRAWKEGREPALEVRLAMPPGQAEEYQRLLGLAVGVNDVVGALAGLLRQQVETLSVRHAWLSTVHLWGVAAEVLREDLQLAAGKPESGHRRRERADGLRRAQAVLERMPRPLAAPGEGERGDDGRAQPSLPGLSGVLLAGLQDGMRRRWQELRAAELVADEVQRELGGEDPLLPEVQELLTEGKGELARLRDEVAPYAGAFELPEPDEELVTLIREAVERAARA